MRTPHEHQQQLTADGGGASSSAWGEHADTLLHEVASLLSSISGGGGASALVATANPLQRQQQSSSSEELAASNSYRFSRVDADRDLARLNELLDAQMQNPFPPHHHRRASDLQQCLSLPRPIPVPTVAASLDAHPPPPPSLLEVPLTSAKQGAKTTRERQKEELALLRVQVVELEAQLESHKQLHREIAAPDPAASSAPSQDKSSLPSSWWAKAAERQLREKNKAEAENNRLREMALSQLRLAKSLEKVLEKRRMCEDAAQARIKRPRPQGSSSDNENDKEEDPKDAAIFASLKDSINSRASDDVDALFKTHGLDAIVKDSVATDINHDSDGMHLDFKVVKLYPFDYREVNDAAWQIAQRELINQGQHGCGSLLESTEDVVAMKLLTTPKPNMSLTLRSVFKRVSEAGRVVYTFETQAESASDGNERHHQAFSSISYRESGCMTIAPVLVPNVAVATSTKLFTHLTPTFAAATESDSQSTTGVARARARAQMTDPGVSTDLLIALRLQRVRRFHETMQDLLVDNHVASMSTTTSSYKSPT